jgi:superfamily II DNA or RNA helicase
LQTGVVSNKAELFALEEIIKPVIQECSWASIKPNFALTLNDGSSRIIDFAIVTERSHIAIEIDGYAYHAEGAISRHKFDDHLDRQNELILQGWAVLRFSFDQTQRETERCRDQLRRLLVDDDLLHRNFSRTETQPTAIQVEALAALAASRAIGRLKGVVALPTGTGKTILSALDAKLVGGRVLFVAHNNEILRQAARAYSKVFGDTAVGFINSTEEHGPDKDLVFANVASFRLGERLEQFARDHFSYVVIDEFHHGAAPSYQKLLKHFQPKFFLGLTATPERTDKQDVISLLDGNLIFSITTAEAIDRGYLVPFCYYGLKDNIDYSEIAHNGYRYEVSDLEKALLIPKRDEAIFNKFNEYAKGSKTIGFCVSIKHADRMAEFFSERGVPSVAIHSGLSLDERSIRINQFERGEVRCVFTRDLFNEGVDVPDTDALLFLRPTESRIVLTQQLGRGLRISPGKKSVRVLDFIGNYKGAERLPEIIQSIAGPIEDEENRRGAKPILIYDNGCQIYFEAEVIENIVVTSISGINPLYYFERIAARSQKLERPLSPLDIYLLLEDAMVSAISACGGYRAFAEKMNSVENEIEVIDVEFSSIDFSKIIEETSTAEDLASIGAVALDILDRIAQSMFKMPVNPTRKYGVNLAWDVHDLCVELVETLAPMCLMKNNVKAFSAKYDLVLDTKDVKMIDEVQNFLLFISGNSVRRDSFAQTNYIRSEVSNLLALPQSVISSVDPMEASVVALERLLDRRSLTWLVDLLDLTSYRSVDL